jgi:hypothetical protein
MKYTICGFQQDELIRLGLDHTDALILRYIVDFYSTGKMCQRVKENRVWFWFKYDTICSEMPVIGIKTPKHVADIMRKWEKVGLVMKDVIRGVDEYMLNGLKLTRRGVYVYFSFDQEKIERLLTAEKTALNKCEVPGNPQRDCGKNRTGSAENSAIKDSSFIHPSFIDPSVSPTGEVLFSDEGWVFLSNLTAYYHDDPEQVFTWKNLPRGFPYDVMEKMDRFRREGRI